MATSSRRRGPGAARFRIRGRPPAARFCRHTALEAATRLPAAPAAAADGTRLACSVIPMRIAPKFRRGKFDSRAARSPHWRLRRRLRARRFPIRRTSRSSRRWPNRRPRLQFPKLTDRQRFLVGPIEPHLQFDKCSRPIKARGRLAAAHERSGDDRAALPGSKALAPLRAGQDRRHLARRGRGACHCRGYRRQSHRPENRGTRYLGTALGVLG